MNNEHRQHLAQLQEETHELMGKVAGYVHGYDRTRFGAEYTSEDRLYITPPLIGGTPVGDAIFNDLQKHVDIAYELTYLLRQYLEHGVTGEVEAYYGHLEKECHEQETMEDV